MGELAVSHFTGHGSRVEKTGRGSKKTGHGSKNRSRVKKQVADGKNGSRVIFSMSDPNLFQLPKQRPEVLAQSTAE